MHVHLTELHDHTHISRDTSEDMDYNLRVRADRSGWLGRLCRRPCFIHDPSLYILHREPAPLKV